jgi:uncharacterized protein YigA (DUF484 family)
MEEEVIVGEVVEIAVGHKVVEIVDLQELVPVLTERRDHLDLVRQLKQMWAPRLDVAAAGETVERSEHRRQKKMLEDQNGPRFVLVLVRRDVKPWVIKGEEV